MKKKEIEKLEKLNKEMKLTKEVKNIIAKKALDNFLIALDVLLLFLILIITARKLPKNITLLIYKICSVVLFSFTLFVFEMAYKKDDDDTTIHGIEIFILSVVTLLTPYILVERPTAFTLNVGAYFTAYYILKNLVVYKKEKNKFLRQQSDISQIIKKESKDKIAQEEKEKKNVNQGVQTKKGRPKKTVTNKQSEKTNIKEVSPKKKRGRPKKTVIQ